MTASLSVSVSIWTPDSDLGTASFEDLEHQRQHKNANKALCDSEYYAEYKCVSCMHALKRTIRYLVCSFLS